MKMWSFAFKKQGKIICIYAIASLVIVILYNLFGPQVIMNVGDGWSKFAAFFGLVSLAVTFLVWYGELREDYEESIPKKLNVIYLLENSEPAYAPVMACINATLISEGDIRPMAQQVGAQIVSERSLALSPRIELVAPHIDKINICKVYTIQMYLTSVPTSIVSTRREIGSKAGILRHDTKGKWEDEKVVDLYTELVARQMLTQAIT